MVVLHTMKQNLQSCVFWTMCVLDHRRKHSQVYEIVTGAVSHFVTHG